MDAILNHFSVLAEWGSPAMIQRLEEVLQTATEVLPTAEKYPGGQEAVEQLIACITDALGTGMPPAVMRHVGNSC